MARRMFNHWLAVLGLLPMLLLTAQAQAIAESGLPQFEAISWFALLGPADMPREVQLKINAETATVLAMADVEEKLATPGLDAAPASPEARASLIQAETLKWAKVVKESGAKAD